MYTLIICFVNRSAQASIHCLTDASSLLGFKQRFSLAKILTSLHEHKMRRQQLLQVSWNSYPHSTANPKLQAVLSKRRGTKIHALKSFSAFPLKILLISLLNF